MSAGQSISVFVIQGENAWYGEQIEDFNSCQSAKLNYTLVNSILGNFHSLPL